MHHPAPYPAETMTPQATVTAWTALVALVMGAFGVLSATIPPIFVPREAVLTVAPSPPPPDFVIPVAQVETADLVNTWGAARSHGRKHQGIDIMARAGTPVHAAADGVIVRMTTNELGGIVLYQRDAGGAHVLYYAHLQGYAAGLREGEIVKQGDVIGYVGSTGNATTPHLHFEITRQPNAKRWWGGKPLNPYPVLKAGMIVDSAPQAAEAPGAPKV